MCLALYIGSDSQLPPVPWDDNNPAFYLQELSEEEKPILKIVAKPFVAYAGTSEGCGCAFNCGREHPEYADEPDELKLGEPSRISLRSLLSSIICEHAEVLVYTCCDGDQGMEALSSRRLKLPDLDNKTFVFEEHELLTIVGAD